MRFCALFAASAGSLTLALPTAKIEEKRASTFRWFGANEAGAEFGSNIPGVLGTDYTWPNPIAIQILRDDGMNIFRVPFLMERILPNGLTSSPDATYLQDMKDTVVNITKSGAYVVLDPHNYGRYFGNIISSPSDFSAFWTTIATPFASNDKVIFGTNNEYHDMDQTLVFDLNQAAINAIRAAGATSQYIFVEGNSWSGAWTWPTVNDNLKNLQDTQDKIVYDMHQYFNEDGSSSATCVNSTIGQNRLVAPTQWLIANKKVGFIGEFSGGNDDVCATAVDGMLSYMEGNSNLWLGATWWAAGPWWGDSVYSYEPPSSAAYLYYRSILLPYFME
ncbi:glycoside hydrolase family 5 protein [Cadophora sp. DSE1049]|nr:glycoside hydrolase family 5 protein [Cadophora sp. DSE1049]